MDYEHQDIVLSAAAEMDLRDVLSACNNYVSLYGVWSIVKGFFDSLCHFIGGTVSVFPGADQLESDFLIVNSEKDEFQTDVAKISLKGILHSKHFYIISSLLSV